MSTLAAPVESETMKTYYTTAKAYKDIPGPSFFGMTWMFIKDPSKRLKIDSLFKGYFDMYGPIFGFNIPGLGNRVFIQNPEDAKTLLANDGKNPIEAGFDFWVYYRNQLKKDLYPETTGLVGSHGEDWYNVRSKVQQDMLRPKSAMFYIDSIEDISQDFAEVMERKTDAKGEVDDVTKYLYRWSLESIATIFLDAKLGCLEENLPADSDTNRLIKAVDVALGQDASELAGGMPIWKYIATPSYKRFDKASDEIYNVSKKYIDEAIEKSQNSESAKRNDDEMSVLEKLIKKCGPNSQIPLVMAQDAIMAGIDTTGNTTAFLLYDLAVNPEQQEKLFQEIKAVIGDEKITEAKIKKMKYLKACLHESQRIKPAIMGFNRRTQVDMVLAGYQIPKGEVIGYMTCVNMNDSEHFENPEKFIPERWLRGCPEQHSAHPFVAIPFSHGPRMCIGRRFAELECFILVIKLLQKFSLEYHHEPVHGATEFVTRPDRKIKMKFIPRN